MWRNSRECAVEHTVVTGLFGYKRDAERPDSMFPWERGNKILARFVVRRG